MRILALVTEAFGGRGGIAQYGRDFLTALCSRPGCTEVVALPRLVPDPPSGLPPGLTWLTGASGGKLRYTATLLNVLGRRKPFGLIICGHINLLPLAAFTKKLTGAPMVLLIYGIEAWRPTGNPLTNRLAGKVSDFISISDHTRRKFLEWSGNSSEGRLLPNCVEIGKYGPAPKNPELLERYGLKGKRVLLTMGRLDARERYKGVDEVLSLLPQLTADFPDISYLVCGEGTDRRRLEEKSQALGLHDRVVFAGYIQEGEKADHYRLADAYVMPGRGEGFGFVLLEAMACGIPVVASTADGSAEAVLHGKIGLMADPERPREVSDAIVKALRTSERTIPPGLETFSCDRYRENLYRCLGQVSGVSA